jgi:hypothetical protein
VTVKSVIALLVYLGFPNIRVTATRSQGMVEVQDKQVVSSGSVPAVLPTLLATIPTRAAATHDVASILLIVALPSLFWCGVIAGVAALSSYDVTTAPIAFVGALLACFLIVIRASLMIDRST